MAGGLLLLCAIAIAALFYVVERLSAAQVASADTLKAASDCARVKLTNEFVRRSMFANIEPARPLQESEVRAAEAACERGAPDPDSALAQQARALGMPSLAGGQIGQPGADASTQALPPEVLAAQAAQAAAQGAHPAGSRPPQGR